jgi:DNA-binding ferritin-like protein
MTAALQNTADTDAAHRVLCQLQRADGVTHDIYVDLVGLLDKYRWMLKARAQ